MSNNPVKISKDEDCIAHVKAQVMTRDDGKGGWVPLGSGGMSDIGLCRNIVTIKEDTIVEFFILGRRMADKSMVLKCPLKKDLQYTRANPTFHHWKTETGKFGLTFQSSTEARLFEKSIRKLVESLKHGCPEKTLKLFRDEDQGHFMKLNLPLEKKDSMSQPESTTSTTVSTPSPRSPISPHHHHHHHHHHYHHHHQHQQAFIYNHHDNASTMPKQHKRECSVHDESSDDVLKNGDGKTNRFHKPPSYFTFPPLNVRTVKGAPRGKNSCISLPDTDHPSNSQTVASRRSNGHGFVAHGRPSTGKHGRGNSTNADDPPRQDSYVELKQEAEFQYSYPQFDTRSSISQGSLEKNILPSVPDLPSTCHVFQLPLSRSKSKTPPPSSKKLSALEDNNPSRRLLGTKSRCMHCQETFVPDENRHGSCPDAPDSVVKCIDRISCCCCARAFIYHCFSEQDEDQPEFNMRSCDRTSCRRWMALAFLSLAVPCLCCYWPMTACHSCAVTCGVCGGRHSAMS